MEEWVLRIVHTISSLPKSGQTQVIAIDGRCASGKTTLAEQLRGALDCAVVHMDEFFLRPEQRTPERLCAPGGNVDYERFRQEVMIPLKQGTAFQYRPYDCKRQTLAEPIRIVPREIVIVEGSYSCHPALWDSYDLRIFLTVEHQEQMRRIRKRNGEQAAETFLKKWIPMEELYFSTYRIESRCDLCYKNCGT